MLKAPRLLRTCCLVGCALIVYSLSARAGTSKLSAHLIGSYSGGAKQLVAAAPVILKILDANPEMLAAARDYKRLNPHGRVVLRIYTPLRFDRSTPPQRAAAAFWQKVLLPALRALSAADRRLIDYLEGPNEGDSTPTWGTLHDAKWYNAFWLALAPRIHDAGYRPCGFSIAVGNPPGDPSYVKQCLDAIVPALRLIHSFRGAWSYHAYTLGYTTDPTVEAWYSLRYRQYHSYFAARYPDLATLPLMLTEGGVDQSGAPASSGWQARGSLAKYVHWLSWFDGQLQQDPYVIGVTLFELGDPRSWPSFDLEPAAPWLAKQIHDSHAARVGPGAGAESRAAAFSTTLRVAAAGVPRSAQLGAEDSSARSWLQTPDPPSPQFTLFRGGQVVDGSGRPAFRADVRVFGRRIWSVGRLRPKPRERIVNAIGLVICPGFIDAHSHVDGGLLQQRGAETHIRQGITTSVVGQDGSSHIPLRSFFQQLERTPPALNIASFAGEGTIRSLVMGANYKRSATAAEVQKMRKLVADEMNAGALGLSTGLEYDPGFYSTTDELVQCSAEAARKHGIYISHVRDEGDRALQSFRELIEISRRAHLPAQISHIKLDTRPVWGQSARVLKLMRDARRNGLDITADVYPYTFWQSTIIVIIPTRDWSNRAAWKTGLDEVGGAEHIRLTSYTPDAAWSGRTIAEISKSTGMDPISVIQKIVQNTHGPGAKGQESVVVTAMTETDLRRFIADPHIMFCTDGAIRGTHPRGAGSFPRVLCRYVRQQRLLTLPQAIHKMSELPAQRFGFHDRGLVKPGMKADLVLLNPRTVRDTATVAHPLDRPIGIVDVMVNGKLVLDQGRMTSERPGEVLRRR